MLQVIIPPPTGSIATFGQGGEGGWVLHDDGALHPRAFGAAVMFPNGSSTIDSFLLEGSIETTPSRYLTDENDCHHINFRGSIFPASGFAAADSLEWTNTLPGRYTEKAENSFYLSRTNTGGSITWFADLLPYNRDAELCYLWKEGSLENGKPVYFQDHSNVYTIRFRDNLCYMGYARANWTGQSSTGWACTQLTIIEYSPTRGFRWTYINPTFYPKLIKTSQDLLLALDKYYDAAYKPVGPWYPSLAYPVIGLGFHYNGTQTLPDRTTLLDRLMLGVDDLFPVNLYSDVDWGELSYRAVDQVQSWDSNGLSLSKEMIGLRKEVRSVLGLIKNIDDPKTWASAYLSFKYGMRLTVSDTKSLIAAMMKEQNLHLGPAKVSSSARFSKNGCACEAHYAIYYQRSPEIIDQIYSALNEYDVAPTMSNLWDLIPWTFVIDWFVDFGGLLDRLDAVSSISSHRIVGDMRSLKLTRNFLPDYLDLRGWGGSVDVIKYDRVSSCVCVLPSLVLDLPVTKGFDHWIEAGALMLQKIIH